METNSYPACVLPPWKTTKQKKSFKRHQFLWNAALYVLNCGNFGVEKWLLEKVYSTCLDVMLAQIHQLHLTIQHFSCFSMSLTCCWAFYVKADLSTPSTCLWGNGTSPNQTGLCFLLCSPGLAGQCLGFRLHWKHSAQLCWQPFHLST